MAYVIKRNGEKKAFEKKLIESSIQKAVVDAGFAPDDMEENVKLICDRISDICSKKEFIQTSEIREIILKELDARNKKVSDAWRMFDKRYKKIK